MKIFFVVFTILYIIIIITYIQTKNRNDIKRNFSLIADDAWYFAFYLLCAFVTFFYKP